jgi:HD-GYP domain-containing protein (c-di-GMP phosphodiesterase class II)
VVDVWDALTSDRPYRAAWTPERTLTYIQKRVNQHFDPDVVEVFTTLMAGKQMKDELQIAEAIQV